MKPVSIENLISLGKSMADFREKNTTSILKTLADAWHSPLVARKEVDKFSGGLLNPRTMSNLDCNGKGPPRIRLGRCIAYPTVDLIKWMEDRMEVLK